MKTVIMTDSTCDINPREYESLGIEVVPLTVLFGGTAYLDGVNITKEEFYKKLTSEDIFPTTSQPSPQRFLKIFEKHKEQGNEIVYIGVSSALSGTFQSAKIANELCDYENIYMVDSMAVTVPLELLVRYACQLRDKGLSAKEIAELIEVKKEKVRVYAIVDTMEYLVKGGRVPKAAGKLGGALGVKPMVTLKNGGVHACDYARGRQRKYQKLLEYIKKDDVDASMPIALLHADDELSMKEMELYFYSAGVKYNWIYSSVGSVIGAHTGPYAVGISYFVK